MYLYIKGSLEVKTKGYIVVECNGIGYKIFMSDKSLNEIGNVGDTVKVYTHYHVREDEISLYGFKTDEELRMFELLLSVSGIGARSAITMLSNIEPSEFAFAVISDDVDRMTKIPGIGKKTAQRIILELKDKLKTEQAISKDEKIKASIHNEEIISEAVSALQILGYTKKEINSVIEKLEIQNLNVEEIIKKALTILGK